MHVGTRRLPSRQGAIVSLFRDQGYRVAIARDGVNDQASLRRAHCGIAVEGASEAARSAADVVFLAPGIARIVNAMRVSSQAFQQAHIYLLYHTTIGMHLCIVLVGSYLLYGTSPVDLRWSMLNLHISDLIGTQVSYDDGRTPFSWEPVGWRVRRFVRTVLGFAIVLTRGTFFTIWATCGTLNDCTSLSQQTAFFGAMLTDHWQCLFILTNGRFWTHVSHWKSLSIVLAVDLRTRLSHFGWAGFGAMNASVAIRIWSVALGTLVASTILCWLSSDGELVSKQIHFEADENGEMQNEDPEELPAADSFS